MSRRVLVFDQGLNLGDNCRGLLVFKAFKLAHPDLELVLWLSPETNPNVVRLIETCRAVDRVIERDRSPERSCRINADLIKTILARGKSLIWSACPPGKGPDGDDYDHVVPTAEPWFTAKLIQGRGLDQPETINQGRFLADLLELDQDRVAAALPLLGRRDRIEPYVTVGLNRPRPDDPKQLPSARCREIWDLCLSLGPAFKAVDLQDWLPPPTGVEDMRAAALEDKMQVFNRAALHIGLDGGLNHFAAVCGCPTVAFFSGPGDDPGRVFGPWPRRTPFGRHYRANDYRSFLMLIESRLKSLTRGEGG